MVGALHCTSAPLPGPRKEPETQFPSNSVMGKANFSLAALRTQRLDSACRLREGCHSRSHNSRPQTPRAHTRAADGEAAARIHSGRGHGARLRQMAQGLRYHAAFRTPASNAAASSDEECMAAVGFSYEGARWPYALAESDRIGAPVEQVGFQRQSTRRCA